uniref:type IV pilus secretin PilQ n=1 Tax=Halomonas sp. TaxID=1486246 RepID=UPI00260AE67A|nr:type IV pilus secretin PilQ [Halomonas sp.]
MSKRLFKVAVLLLVGWQWEAEVAQSAPAYHGAPMSLSFEDAPLGSVLSAISEFTGLNIVVGEGVGGRVTLRLDSVPWDQALDLVLKSQGLTSRREANVILVAPATEIAQREQSKLLEQEKQRQWQPLVTEHVQVRYAKAADLADLLRGAGGFGLLSQRGSAAADSRTNMLLIQDTAEHLGQIRQTLRQLDVPAPQVQIEARIVVVKDSAARQIGVNWGVTSTMGMVDKGNGSMSLERKIQGHRGAYGGLAVDLGDSLGPGTTFNIGYLAGDVLLDLELRALQSEGKSQIISQPKVITANQHTAIIKQGKEIPYQESTGDGATSTAFKEAVLALEVTPQITSDHRIVMDLKINNDTLADQTFRGAPAIDTNEIMTQVLADDGETIVLGGILTSEQAHSLYKTPWLGDIPLVGKLFRYTEDVNDKVELLVFITPRILDDGLAIR